MNKTKRIIITILALLSACVPFGLSLIFLKPIPEGFELPLTAHVFSAIGIVALLMFSGWLLRFVIKALWEKRGD